MRRSKVRRIIEKVCAAVVLLGFFAVYGTIGACETDYITLGQCVVRCIVIFSVMLFALNLGGFLND